MSVHLALVFVSLRKFVVFALKMLYFLDELLQHMSVFSPWNNLLTPRIQNLLLPEMYTIFPKFKIRLIEGIYCKVVHNSEKTHIYISLV